MKHWKSIVFSGLFSGILLFVSCYSVPVTGRQSLILISSSEEMKLGLSAYNEIMKESTISDDEELNRAVAQIGTRISQVTEKPDLPWEFNTIVNDVPNAFALPGGKVAIHTGIIPIAVNEAGLATVMGHEIGHAIARHGAERMSQAILLYAGSIALSVSVKDKSSKEKFAWMTAYGLASSLALVLPFSRLHELEADRLGFNYMAKAGYDPNEAVYFWERFAEENSSKNKNMDFFSTHPAETKRAAQLRRYLPEALKLYEESDQIGLGNGLSYKGTPPPKKSDTKENKG